MGDVKLGVMIETPAMVLMAKEIARRADFASIGTNDLCQYLTAADRMNPTVAPYCRSTHPALYRAIDIVARAFREEGKPICVCGELAGDVQAACVLAGLGLRKLSMSISQVAKVNARWGGTQLWSCKGWPGKFWLAKTLMKFYNVYRPRLRPERCAKERRSAPCTAERQPLSTGRACMPSGLSVHQCRKGV